MGHLLDALRTELLEMQRADQEALFRVGADPHASAEAVLRANVERLKEIVKEHGYPGRSLVGDGGAHAAWLVVQHADFDRVFQQAFLKLMEDAAGRGEATRRELAYLTDRVCVGAGIPQIYGTQCEPDGEWTRCRALGAPDAVDQRRAQVGLEPLAQYVCGLVAFNVAWRRDLRNATIAMGDPGSATSFVIRAGAMQVDGVVEWDPAQRRGRLVGDVHVRPADTGESTGA